MTNPNLVSSNVIKGFSRTVNLSNADVLVLDNPTNSYNVIKINKISVARNTTNVTTSDGKLWIERSNSEYKLIESIDISGFPDDGYDFPLIETTIYLQEGDKLWAKNFLNNDNTWQIDLVVNYEVITDQSTLTYSEPVLTGRSKGEAPERRVKGSGVELGGAQHAYLAGGFYREDIEYFSLDTQLNSTSFGTLDPHYFTNSSHTAGWSAGMVGLSDGSRILWAGGGVHIGSSSPALESREISYINTSSAGNSKLFDGLKIYGTEDTSGGEDGVRGFIIAGQMGASPKDYVEVVNIGRQGDATLYGNLHEEIKEAHNSAVSDGSRALSFGGWKPSGGFGYSRNNKIYYMSLTSGTTTGVFGDVVSGSDHQNLGAACNGIRAIAAGGYDNNWHNDIMYVTVSTLGNATDFGGNLVGNVAECGATSSASRMVFMSGTTGSGGSTTNRIDQINPMSSGNATSFGTLLNSRYRATASYGGGNNFDIYRNPNTTYNYTISGTVNSSDFDSYGTVQPNTIPYSGSLTTNHLGHANMRLSFADDASMEGDEFVTIDFTDLKFNNLKVLDISTGFPVGDRAVNFGGTRIIGGSYVNWDDMEYFSIANAGGSGQVFGDLSMVNATRGGMSTGDGSRIIYTGGYGQNTSNSWGRWNYIEYITSSTPSNSTNFGYTHLRYHQNGGANSNGSRAVTGGGYTYPGTPSGRSDDMEYMTIDPASSVTFFGNLTEIKDWVHQGHDGSRGLFAFGYGSSSYSGVINYVNMSSTGNASFFGFSSWHNGSNGGVSVALGSAQDGTRVTWGGGYRWNGSQYGYSDRVEYVTVQTPSNASVFGYLNTARQDTGLTSNDSRAVLQGGYSPGTRRSDIETWNIGTTSSASIFGTSLLYQCTTLASYSGSP